MIATAAQLTGPQQPVRVQSTEIGSPGPGEVLVRMQACGICHSDVFISSLPQLPLVPVTLGHEGIGVVVEAGPGVAREGRANAHGSDRARGQSGARSGPAAGVVTPGRPPVRPDPRDAGGIPAGADCGISPSRRPTPCRSAAPSPSRGRWRAARAR